MGVIDLGLGFKFKIWIRVLCSGYLLSGVIRLGIRLRYLRFKVRIGLEFKVDL